MAHPYTRELAATVNEMFADGINDPREDEIAKKYYDPKPIDGDVVETVRKRLRQIMEELHRIYGHSVCLLGEGHYAKYNRGSGRRRSNRELPPRSDEHAKRSLPIGQAKKGVGIWRSHGENDLIFQASVEFGGAIGAAVLKRVVKRTMQAVEDGRASPERSIHNLGQIEAQTRLSAADRVEEIQATAARRARRPRLEPPE